jgi:hypothetical protein
MIGKLLSLFLVGLVSLVALGVALSIIGVVFSIAFGVGTFLLLKVAPIVLVGWVVLKLIDRGGSKASLSEADRKWLESGN